MPATGVLNILGGVVNPLGGNKSISPPAITSTNACGEVLTIPLNSGDNTIAIPTNATAVVITPPAGNIIALKLKGAGGDTGFFISKTNPAEIPFDNPPPASIIINAAGAVTAFTEFNFV